MKNYYITGNNKKIEIIDKQEINLSDKKIKEIHITSLNKCERLDLDNNSLTIFKTSLKHLYLILNIYLYTIIIYHLKDLITNQHFIFNI